MTTTTSDRKLIRVRLRNRQVVGQLCGWGEGRTHEEAVQDAIRRAGGDAKNAAYCPQSGEVLFDGGCYL